MPQSQTLGSPIRVKATKVISDFEVIPLTTIKHNLSSLTDESSKWGAQRARRCLGRVSALNTSRQRPQKRRPHLSMGDQKGARQKSVHLRTPVEGSRCRLFGCGKKIRGGRRRPTAQHVILFYIHNNRGGCRGTFTAGQSSRARADANMNDSNL